MNATPSARVGFVLGARERTHLSGRIAVGMGRRDLSALSELSLFWVSREAISFYTTEKTASVGSPQEILHSPALSIFFLQTIGAIHRELRLWSRRNQR